jgi:hypothetical protein
MNSLRSEIKDVICWLGILAVVLVYLTRINEER